eukprot:4485079-Heterocapsa_arctica.AAC.1
MLIQLGICDPCLQCYVACRALACHSPSEMLSQEVTFMTSREETNSTQILLFHAPHSLFFAAWHLPSIMQSPHQCSIQAVLA